MEGSASLVCCFDPPLLVGFLLESSFSHITSVDLSFLLSSSCVVVIFMAISLILLLFVVFWVNSFDICF